MSCRRTVCNGFIDDNDRGEAFLRIDTGAGKMSARGVHFSVLPESGRRKSPTAGPLPSGSSSHVPLFNPDPGATLRSPFEVGSFRVAPSWFPASCGPSVAARLYRVTRGVERPSWSPRASYRQAACQMGPFGNKSIESVRYGESGFRGVREIAS